MNENRKRRIAILTSGGDAPGMNSVISSVYKTINAINLERQASKNLSFEERPLELLLIKNGYKGILEKQIYEIDSCWKELINISVKNGGTILGSSRCKEFKEEESTRKEAKKILDDFGVEALIGLGGDGTYKGLAKLSELGLKCVGIPATIDNDIASTDVTIGFDTAVNTIVRSIDQIRETTTSHSRISIVEVMGRNCGDLAINAAVNCDLIALPSEDKDKKMTEHELIRLITDLYSKRYLRSIIVLVTENLYDVKRLAKTIEQELKVETRETVLGQIQRGGSPSAFDRYLATMMGIVAVEQIEKKNSSSVIIGLEGNKLQSIPIQDALDKKKTDRLVTVNKILRLSGIKQKE